MNTNRRGFFDSVAGVFTAAVLALHTIPDIRFGLVDVDRWKSLGFYEKCRVLVSGVDVTGDCFEFNEREGWAKVFKRDSAGNHYVEFPDGNVFYSYTRDAAGKISQNPPSPLEAAKETLYGRIEIVRSKELRMA